MGRLDPKETPETEKIKFAVYSASTSATSIDKSRWIHSSPAVDLINISSVSASHACDDSHGIILAWKYGGQHTNNLLSTPAHYGNNYCHNQSAKLQTHTEALLSERERWWPPSPLSGLSASFRAWPLCPSKPSALFPVTNTFLSPSSGCGGHAV